MSAPAPHEITDWLEKLGLGQYAPRFVENEITHSILPDLTDADLKELGVAYKLVKTIPAEEAWRPLDQGGCSLVKKG